MSANYASYLATAGPSWLQRTNGVAYLGAIGATLDQCIAWYKDGVKASFPGLAGQNGDALALSYLGDEIGMPRGPSESLADYGERLRKAWEVWPWAGTALGLLLALETQGYDANNGAPVVIQQARYAFTLTAADPSQPPVAPETRLVRTTLGATMGEPGWNFDGNAGLPPSQGLWSRAGLLFSSVPTGWNAPAVPPTTVTAPTTNQINNVIATIQKWKPAKVNFLWIKLLASGRMWGWPPSQTWGMGGAVWGGSVYEWSASTYY